MLNPCHGNRLTVRTLGGRNDYTVALEPEDAIPPAAHGRQVSADERCEVRVCIHGASRFKQA